MSARTFTLLDRVPRGKQARATRAKVQELVSLVAEALDVFEVSSDISEVVEGKYICIKVMLEGEDTIPAMNFLNVKFGVGKEMGAINPGDEIHRARIVAPGGVGFGVFFDIGMGAGKHALYPLHRMREQLAGGKTIPARPLIKTFGFCEQFSLPVVVTKTGGGKVEIEMSPRVVEEFTAWRMDGLDRVFCHGEHARVLERALKEKLDVRHHTIAQETGFLDAIITVDKRTDGPGIMSLLGPHFSHVKMAVFNAGRARALLS